MQDHMKAATFIKPGAIILGEKPIPMIGPLDALIRTTMTTICGTDIHILKGEYPVASGLTAGHEPVGSIERLGAAVEGFSVGQPVMAGPLPCDEALAAPDPVDGIAELIDRSVGAMRAQWTLGVAPDALGAAFADWWLHLASAPGRQLLLTVKAARKWQRLIDYSARAAASGGEARRCIQPLPQDQRFTAGEWDVLPFGLYQQAFLLGQQWLDAAVRENSGVTSHHDAVVRFVMRQLLDMFSPANFIATNPVVQKRLLETGGTSLVHGLQLLADDW